VRLELDASGQPSLALAQFFDHPASHHRLAKISKVQIDFCAGVCGDRSVVCGWLGAQLDWKIDAVKSSRELRFTETAGRPIEVEFA